MERRLEPIDQIRWNDLETWEKQQLQYLPDYLAYDFRHMYKFFQEKGLKASAEAIDRSTRVLGHPPRTYEAFVRETVSAWAAVV